MDRDRGQAHARDRGNGAGSGTGGMSAFSWHWHPASGVPVLRDVGTYPVRTQIAPAEFFFQFFARAICESAAPMLARTRVHGRDVHDTNPPASPCRLVSPSPA